MILPRKTARPARFAALALAAFALVQAAFGQTFTHPGALHTQADFDRMRTKVLANAQPWKGSWDILVANPHSSTGWTPRPVATAVRGGTGDNSSLVFNDAHAAYQSALRWKISNDTAYANQSIRILNAWSSTLTSISGNADRFLMAGLQGYQFANAAEIMRTYSGWASADQTRFKNMMRNVWLPVNESFLFGLNGGQDHNGACITNYWANWDLANMNSMLAIGILCDDRTIYNKAVNYFKTGRGNGALYNCVPYLHGNNWAQWQEMGRDQGHTLMGVGQMATFCEMAWNQGDNLYAWDNHRLLRAFEYVAAYNTNNNVPYIPYTWGQGTNCAVQVQTAIGSGSRGNVRPIWDMIYHHYVNRVGIQSGLVPRIGQIAASVRPEGGGGNYGSTSGGYDQLGFTTLTCARDAINGNVGFPAPAGHIPNGTYRIVNRRSGKALEVANGSTANGANVQQWTYNGGANQRWTITHLGLQRYSIIGVGSGKALEVNGASQSFGANVDIWPYSSSSQNHIWILTPYDGYYRLQALHSGQALNVSGGSTADGANVLQYPFDGGANAQWSFQAP